MPANIEQSRRATRPKPVARKSPLKHHILLADDDSEMRSMLALALMHEGYNVIECCNGEELSLCLKESNTQCTERVDLVISDIRMPGMSGLGVLATHGQKPKCPPMILMTAFGDDKARHEATRMGAVAFFDKPFELDELLQKVREITPP